MRFIVAQSYSGVTPAGPTVVLEPSTWDDYTYKTTFRAFLSVESGPWQDLGKVKILHETVKTTRLVLPADFRELGSEFCSLGQTAQYYQLLHAAFGPNATHILEALGDITLSSREGLADHPGVRRSLLRFSDTEEAQKTARRLFGADIGQPQEKPEFTLRTLLDGFSTEHVLQIAFPAEGETLGRIAAIAGRNGSGKTQLLARLGAALSGLNLEDSELEPRVHHPVVAISFNVFDGFTSPRGKIPGNSYRYYGLRAPGTRSLPPGKERSLSSPSEDIVRRSESPPVIDFNWAFERLRESLDVIWRTQEPLDTWRRMLGAVGLFVNEPDLLPEPDFIPGEGELYEFMDRLRSASSGHQFLVFVVTALVEGVRQGTIVLLDEIETHLHPHLLTATLHMLYDFLRERGAYAVLATHSPVVLQEIPAGSIRVVRLMERRPHIRAYPGESLGGSLEDITREGFGVDEDGRSYTTILGQLLEAAGGDRKAVEQQLPGLGLGARMLLRDLAEKGDVP
jgi:predicted ATPase